MQAVNFDPPFDTTNMIVRIIVKTFPSEEREWLKEICETVIIIAINVHQVVIKDLLVICVL